MNRFLTTLLLLMMTLGHLQYAEAKRAKVTNVDHNAMLVAKAAMTTGVTVDILAGFSGAESGLNHRAKSDKSSATGVCQFTGRTWRTTLKTYGKKYGLARNTRRTDAYANALMCGEYIKENRRYLNENLARRVTPGDLYLAHIISPQKVVKLEHVSSNRSAASIMPDFAAANYNLFYHRNGKAKTVAAFRAGIYAKLKANTAVYSPIVERHIVRPVAIANVSKRQALPQTQCPRPDSYTTVVSESMVHTTRLITIDPNGTPQKPKSMEKGDCYLDRRRMV